MGWVFVPLWQQVAGRLEGEAAPGSDVLAASGTDLGTALVPLVALAASLVAAVAVATLIVAWLRKPEPSDLVELADPKTAGLLSVGFVSGTAAQRWLPATVLQLACDHVLTIEDRRNGAIGNGRAKDVRLVFGVPDAVAKGAIATERVVPGPAEPEPEPGESVAVVVAAVFGPGMSGESLRAVRGSSVDVSRVVARNRPLVGVTRDRFVAAAEVYREPRPVGRFRVATVGGVFGVVLGIVSLWQDAAAQSIAWSSIVIGAIALGLRVLLPRWIPLNATGLLLRERAEQLRDELTSTESSTASSTAALTIGAGEQLLPWAVLFDQPATIRRIAELGSGDALVWYRSTEPFSAERLASCLALLTAQLTQPILIGPKLPWMGDGSRFGVPGLNDHIWRSDDYFGRSRSSDFSGFGGAAGDVGGSGGFDGGYGGFDVGGFDGGGGN